MVNLDFGVSMVSGDSKNSKKYFEPTHRSMVFPVANICFHLPTAPLAHHDETEEETSKGF